VCHVERIAWIFLHRVGKCPPKDEVVFIGQPLKGEGRQKILPAFWKEKKG